MMIISEHYCLINFVLWPVVMFFSVCTVTVAA